jgi:AbrB family looped-hinge helix DNA binding protein
METAKMTSKGQLVIPKKIRDAVRAKSGTRFSVRVDGSKIVLEIPRPQESQTSDWSGLNPKKRKLSAAKLCEPVRLPKSGRGA